VISSVSKLDLYIYITRLMKYDVFNVQVHV